MIHYFHISNHYKFVLQVIVARYIAPCLIHCLYTAYEGISFCYRIQSFYIFIVLLVRGDCNTVNGDSFVSDKGPAECFM